MQYKNNPQVIFIASQRPIARLCYIINLSPHPIAVLPQNIIQHPRCLDGQGAAGGLGVVSVEAVTKGLTDGGVETCHEPLPIGGADPVGRFSVLLRGCPAAEQADGKHAAGQCATGFLAGTGQTAAKAGSHPAGGLGLFWAE